MEEKGSGFDKIEEDYQNYDEKHKPYISADGTSFTLTLPDLTYDNGIPDINQEEIPEIYALQILNGKNDEKILSFCYYSARPVSAIAQYVGVKPSTYFRTHTIARLVREGLLLETKPERVSLYQTNWDKVRLKG